LIARSTPTNLGATRRGSRNNSIAAGPGAAFLLGGIAGITIAGNAITRCATDPQPAVALGHGDDNVEGLIFDGSNTVTNRSDAWLCEKANADTAAAAAPAAVAAA